MANDIIHKKREILKGIKFEEEAKIDPDIRDAFFCPTLMKHTRSPDVKKTSDEIVNVFLQDEWQSEYDRRLHTAYYTAIDYNSRELGRPWSKTILSSAWVKEFERILKQEKSSFKYQLKIMFPLWMTRSATGALYLLSSLAGWWSDLQEVISARGDVTPWLMVEVWCVSTSLFAQFFSYWLKPRLWLEKDHFVNKDKEGKSSYGHGMEFCLTLKANGRFRDFTTYLRSIVNPNYFAVQSRIDKMTIPAKFDHPALHDIALGYDKNGYHFLDSFSQVAGASFTTYWCKTPDVLDEIWDTCEFDNGASFVSDAIIGENAEDTIGYILSSYKGYYKSAHSKVKLYNVFSELYKVELDLLEEPGIPAGITKLAQEYIDDR